MKKKFLMILTCLFVGIMAGSASLYAQGDVDWMPYPEEPPPPGPTVTYIQYTVPLSTSNASAQVIFVGGSDGSISNIRVSVWAPGTVVDQYYWMEGNIIRFFAESQCVSQSQPGRIDVYSINGSVNTSTRTGTLSCY